MVNCIPLGIAGNRNYHFQFRISLSLSLSLSLSDTHIPPISAKEVYFLISLRYKCKNLLCSLVDLLFFCCFFLFSVYRPTREFFTHMETSPWPVKGCKFWPMLGTLGRCPLKVFWAATPTVTPGIFVCWSSPRTRGTLPIADRLAVELSIPILELRFVAAGIRTPNISLAGWML